MKKHILNTFAVNLNYAMALVKDVPDEKFCLQPGGVTNHPAFVLGHLAQSCDFAGTYWGAAPSCPKEWNELFGDKAKPTTDRSKYPKKDVLVKAFQDGHARVAKGFEGMSEDALNKSAGEDFAKWGFPTVGSFMVFMLTSHEATHLGQLSSWRRAGGFPSVY